MIPFFREPIERRHVDAPAVWRPRPETGVVVEHEQDVRCTLGSPLELVGAPVGDRVADVEIDRAAEVFDRCRDGVSPAGHRVLGSIYARRGRGPTSPSTIDSDSRGDDREEKVLVRDHSDLSFAGASGR